MCKVADETIVAHLSRHQRQAPVDERSRHAVRTTDDCVEEYGLQLVCFGG